MTDLKKTVMSFGEILWDMLPGGAKLGGAPFNFAYRIHTLGHTSYMVSRIGQDEYGKRALNLMTELGMNTTFIQTDPEYPTGTVDIILDENNQPDYTINPNVAYDFIEAEYAMLTAAKQADCLCFGTLAQRNLTAKKTIQKILADANPETKLLDINLRKDCFNQEIIEDSLHHATVLKLNHEEVKTLTPMLNMNAQSMPDFAKEIIEQRRLKLCIITIGEKGVLASSQEGEIVYEPGFDIELNDPCGSGDAFTAAFMDQWFRGKSLEQCCRYGNALGAIVATHAGATTPVTPDEIEAFLANPPQRLVHDELKTFQV